MSDSSRTPCGLKVHQAKGGMELVAGGLELVVELSRGTALHPPLLAAQQHLLLKLAQHALDRDRVRIRVRVRVRIRVGVGVGVGVRVR